MNIRFSLICIALLSLVFVVGCPPPEEKTPSSDPGAKPHVHDETCTHDEKPVVLDPVEEPEPVEVPDPVEVTDPVDVPDPGTDADADTSVDTGNDL